MMLPLSVWTWQALRVLVRANNEPVTGKVLRIDRSRRTKDGTFLDQLVTDGLLEVVTTAEPLKPKYPGSSVEPAQFRTTYRLTEVGARAAEYGDYEVERTLLPVWDGNVRPLKPAPAKAAKRVKGR